MSRGNQDRLLNSAANYGARPACQSVVVETARGRPRVFDTGGLAWDNCMAAVENAPMLDKVVVTNMWRLLAGFNPETGSGAENLQALRDETIGAIGLAVTDQVKLSPTEMLALALIYDRVTAIASTLKKGKPAIDPDVARQAVEQGLLDAKDDLAPAEAVNLAQRDEFLFRVWALTQIEHVMEHLGQKDPKKQGNG
jgi:hypothetical protein